MQKPTIQIGKSIAAAHTPIRLHCLLAKVRIAPSSDEFQKFSKNKLEAIASRYPVSAIHDVQPLRDTRSAYKSFGKDPSRYRPSAEALLRRVANGKGLYQVCNVVDVLNLVSVETGFSIGGYDLEKIDGSIELGIGAENEHYSAIGRGELNIHCLPVLRDSLGAFGSPASDSTRTMVTDRTIYFLAVFFDFGKNEELRDSLHLFAEWLDKFEIGKVLEKWEI